MTDPNPPDLPHGTVVRHQSGWIGVVRPHPTDQPPLVDPMLGAVWVTHISQPPPSKDLGGRYDCWYMPHALRPIATTRPGVTVTMHPARQPEPVIIARTRAGRQW